MFSWYPLILQDIVTILVVYKPKHKMPPKRKAGAKGKAGGKKVKLDSQAAGDDVKSKMAALKAADAGKKKKKGTPKVDSYCGVRNISVSTTKLHNVDIN